MPYQPRNNGARLPATLRIEADRLLIEADATYARFTAAFGTAPATGLERIWKYSKHVGGVLFPHLPDQTLTENDLDLDTGLPPVGLKRAQFTDVHRFASDLAGAGFNVTHTSLVYDGGHGTFCEQSRDIDVLSIGEFVGITAACYPRWASVMLGLTESPEPASCHRLGTVVLPAGHYLTCANSSWGSWELRAACRIDGIPSADAVMAVPGTRIGRITATCNRCAVSWTASNGALLFTPDSGHRAREWDFRNATGRERSGVDCPSRACAGRVSFTN